MLSVGSLFSGIGGFDLGLERAGMRVLWQAELDPFRRAVLRHHWPDTPCFTDVREVRAGEAAPVDVLCGGFPCQDLSHAGRRAGLGGDHSGLWTEVARVARELRPRYVLVENVAGLLVRGLDEVLADLAALGLDAEWEVIPAAASGAAHLRARLWLLAYPRGLREQADDTVFAGRELTGLHARWDAEPQVARVADGLPGRVDVSALGNALVPQIAEWIGHRIVEAEKSDAYRSVVGMSSTGRAESVIRLNAWCHLCDAIANGTLTDLTNAGWELPAGIDGGWYCREHRGLTADEHEALDGLPWWATWGPHTLEAMCAPLPAVNRSRWTLTGPDVVVVKGELVRYDDDQMRMAA